MRRRAVRSAARAGSPTRVWTPGSAVRRGASGPPDAPLSGPRRTFVCGTPTEARACPAIAARGSAGARLASDALNT